MAWDKWNTGDRILAERANNAPEDFRNYVVEGFVVSNAGSSPARINVTTGVAYINGWRAYKTGETVTLISDAVNRVFVIFVKTPDPEGGSLSIAPAFQVTTGPNPANPCIEIARIPVNASGVISHIYHFENAAYRRRMQPWLVSTDIAVYGETLTACGIRAIVERRLGIVYFQVWHATSLSGNAEYLSSSNWGDYIGMGVPAGKTIQHMNVSVSSTTCDPGG